MTKTSKANLLRLILTTKFKKEYLKTQASEKGCFFCGKNWAYGLWLMAYGLANVKFEKQKSTPLKSVLSVFYTYSRFICESIVGSCISLSLDSNSTLDNTSADFGSSSAKGKNSLPLC